ncbi:MAG: hypothetical protein C0179_03940 [Fervidicoccus sp.]|nr:MAG: hypothetical protein C0179_03940 [Fervidicoccus sp.]
MSIPMARVSEVLKTEDMILLITGILLLIIGALIGNIAYGVASLVNNVFANMTGETSNIFLTPTIISTASMVFQILGVVLIVAAAVHIIATLIRMIPH